MTVSQSPLTDRSMPEGTLTAGVNLTFSYAAGEAASRFLVALRDERKIYGTRCPECRRVLVPARSFCPRCFVDTAEWLAVGPAGTLLAFAPPAEGQGSAPYLPSSFIPHPSYLSFALIRLDGADTALVHRLGDANPRDLRAGLRVVAVFAETRTGSILDIAYFKPA